jgi:hypothetical protein
MAIDYFLGSRTPLTGAAALLVLEDGRYLVQLRDQKPDSAPTPLQSHFGWSRVTAEIIAATAR